MIEAHTGLYCIYVSFFTALKIVFGSLYKDDIFMKPVQIVGVVAAATLFQLVCIRLNNFAQFWKLSLIFWIQSLHKTLVYKLWNFKYWLCMALMVFRCILVLGKKSVLFIQHTLTLYLAMCKIISSHFFIFSNAWTMSSAFPWRFLLRSHNLVCVSGWCNSAVSQYDGWDIKVNFFHSV